VGSATGAHPWLGTFFEFLLLHLSRIRVQEPCAWATARPCSPACRVVRGVNEAWKGSAAGDSSQPPRTDVLN